MNSIQGAGIGLRNPHFRDILACQQQGLWFEVLADNYLIDGGLNLELVTAVSERYPTVLHGVGLSIGSTAPLDWDYLSKVRELMQSLGSHWYSEHLSFSAVDDVHLPDLLPLPYTRESLHHLVDRVKAVQDFLGQPLLLENISSYIQYPHNQMSEADFLAQLAEKADCHLLLDINNLYVSSYNHDFDTDEYLNSLPLDRIRQIHIAGHEDRNHCLLDSHGSQVAIPVWDLLKQLTKLAGPIPTLIEWDTQLPQFEELLQQSHKINRILNLGQD